MEKMTKEQYRVYVIDSIDRTKYPASWILDRVEGIEHMKKMKNSIGEAVNDHLSFIGYCCFFKLEPTDRSNIEVKVFSDKTVYLNTNNRTLDLEDIKSLNLPFVEEIPVNDNE